MTTAPEPENATPDVGMVTDMLRGVIDPELGSDIVDLGMVRSVDIAGDEVTVTIALTTAGCPLRAQIQRDVRERVGSLPGVAKVRLSWSEMSAQEKSTTMARARKAASERPITSSIGPSTRVILVSSGKGGVGKSSVTVNLATAVAAQGFRVGIIDADIWGFSVPRMLGLDGRLQGDTTTGRIRPQIADVDDGQLEVVSMGFLVDDEETPLMWRGLMLNRAVQHFLQDVAWGRLDYLFVDMPPGTGDVQMGLARMMPRAEVIVVTTPAEAAQKVASRVVGMGRQNHLRVLGVVENMSAFIAPDGTSHAIFGTGGGQALADSAGVPLLATIPIEAAVAAGGDAGTPVVTTTGAAADAFRALASLLVDEVAPPIDLAGCSVRLLDAMQASLAAADEDAASRLAAGDEEATGVAVSSARASTVGRSGGPVPR